MKELASPTSLLGKAMVAVLRSGQAARASEGLRCRPKVAQLSECKATPVFARARTRGPYAAAQFAWTRLAR